jgi:hypothetical protein
MSTLPIEPTSERARAVGIKNNFWPYGPNVPEHVQMRADLVNWAEREGLVVAEPSRRCLHWLVGEYRRCVALDYGDRRHYYATDTTLDHATFWTRNGKPALVLAQVYNVLEVAVAEITEKWPVDITTGPAPWYGFATTGVFITPRNT